MRLAVDTSTLISELLRERGRGYLARSHHDYLISERVLSEARHELPRRVERMAARGLPREPLERALGSALDWIESRTRTIPDEALRGLERGARQRVPRDPNDWELVAVALLTGADIWTNDADFLGCGLVTWSTDVLHTLHPA